MYVETNIIVDANTKPRLIIEIFVELIPKIKSISITAPQIFSSRFKNPCRLVDIASKKYAQEYKKNKLKIVDTNKDKFSLVEPRLVKIYET